MVTDDVQKTIVKDLGYLAITDMQVERDVNGKVTKNKQKNSANKQDWLSFFRLLFLLKAR